MNQENKEIDILELFGKVLWLLRKKIFILIIFVLVGLSVGLWINKQKSSTQQFQFVFGSYLINKSIMTEFVNSINKEPFALYKNIQLKGSAKLNDDETSINNNEASLILLTMNVSVPKSSKVSPDTIVDAIKNFFSNSFYEDKVDLRKKQIKELIKAINKKIEDYNTLEPSQMLISNLLFSNDIKFYYDRSIELLKEKHDLQQELKHTTPLTLLHQDVTNYNNKKLIPAIKWGGGFLGIGIFLILVTRLIGMALQAAKDKN
jgi:hypothetical protein